MSFNNFYYIKENKHLLLIYYNVKYLLLLEKNPYLFFLGALHKYERNITTCHSSSVFHEM